MMLQLLTNVVFMIPTTIVMAIAVIALACVIGNKHDNEFSIRKLEMTNRLAITKLEEERRIEEYKLLTADQHSQSRPGAHADQNGTG